MIPWFRGAAGTLDDKEDNNDQTKREDKAVSFLLSEVYHALPVCRIPGHCGFSSAAFTLLLA